MLLLLVVLVHTHTRVDIYKMNAAAAVISTRQVPVNIHW